MLRAFFRTSSIWAIAVFWATSAAAAGYTIIGWNNLGMHCMDADFSVLCLLPPYNTIHAQIIDPSGKLVSNPAAIGLTVTYEAIADTTGSINTTSIGKTNFWTYAPPLFGAAPAPDVGLTGLAMPGAGNVARPMSWDAASGWFVAEGIPITPYDDAVCKNPYPMMRLVARSAAGAMLATTDIVLPVSDEMDCKSCHTSAAGTPAPAMPAGGWITDPDPQREMRLNILSKHDELQADDPAFHAALAALAPVGYRTEGLYATAAISGHPVLCAACHASAALGTTGQPGVAPLTQAVHGGHADVTDPLTGQTLDAAADRGACYRCHPGSVTRCLRGVMGAAVAPDGSLAIQCQNCHGTMSVVGAPDRMGWLQEPTCQSCHTGTATQNSGQIRYTSAFDASGQVRQAANATFATTPNAPAPGLSLYRFSTGHGGVKCEGCHGSTHAEFPSIHASDNVQSLQRQGHVGMLVECGACHGGAQPSTVSGGPHGMHPVGQIWVDRHPDVVESTGPAQCQACHGADYRGTVLSRAKANRTLTGEAGTKSFWRGFQIGCYTCHRGPNNDDPNPDKGAIATDATAGTRVDVPVSIPLSARDPDGEALVLRIVSQPLHGTAGLVGTVATYFPAAGYSGSDLFTFAAWDGSTDSNLATVTVNVNGGAATGTPISGKKLAIKDKAVGPTTSLTFLSRDPSLSSAGIQPTTDGAYLHVFNSAGGKDSACFPLISANWTLVNGVLRYKDAALATSPVKLVVLRSGKLHVVASGKGAIPITYRLGEASQGSVGVVFKSGPTVLCTNFGGTVTQDSGTNPPNPGGLGLFLAKDAPAPGACPTAPETCP
ncbi:MAG TPA: Ig-like domain-containing protein [Candidatus Binatia bacterium]|nr:Ig-like domain-containing protein [Candidatus Binatia bacterium]